LLKTFLAIALIQEKEIAKLKLAIGVWFAKAARWVPMSAEVKQKQQWGECLGKEPEMVYKKPEIVAKGTAKWSFVAGCPEKDFIKNSCTDYNKRCFAGRLN
jgi:hypothetical protein